ncbi:uncharacterized protein LOC144164744 [Haemaphysalis longicornis]
MFGVERFHQYLWGHTFEVVTDHKPLLGLLGPDKAVSVQVLSRSAGAQATSRDQVLSQVVKVVSQREELVERTYSHKAAEVSVQQGCLLWGSRGVIPPSLRFRVLQLLHAGHPRVVKTKMEARFHRYQVCQEN